MKDKLTSTVEHVISQTTVTVGEPDVNGVVMYTLTCPFYFCLRARFPLTEKDVFLLKKKFGEMVIRFERSRDSYVSTPYDMGKI